MPNATAQCFDSSIEPTNSAITSAAESTNVVKHAAEQTTKRASRESFPADLPPILPEDLTEDAGEIPQAHTEPAKLLSPEPKNPDGGGEWLRLKLESPEWKAEKQRVIAGIRECKEKLGRIPTQFELTKMTGVTKYMVQKHFVTYALAVNESGLELLGPGVSQPMAALFRDWARITRELGRAPTITEYSFRSRFSVRPLTRRFGPWKAVTEGLLNYAKENGRQNELGIQTEVVTEDKKPGGAAEITESCTAGCTSGLTSGFAVTFGSAVELNRLPYGESLNPFPMAHAPTNETGVVFAFGMLAKELGFVILHMQAAYPDCVALRWVGENTWRLVRIEIEFQSINFVKHKHDLAGCDLIVCWEDNWPECPVEVLELRKVVKNRVIG